ncbi:hypothetical protein B0H66DRAFT_550902 [Apodospora peruviana]|uniref:Uncharacterized protein n=1 Tax=Apodospora peruviana TaxID=516989 RepID=A0AAE0IJR9_9PEZI|nr:hypothetical protein B0H66DRAFT_550902 [Apodospora peruviana]
MGPDPLTPAPSRFLSSRRPATQQTKPQNQTPQRGIQQTPAGGVPLRQFYATPRFSSSSKPPASSNQAVAAPAFSTQASRTRSLRASRSTQDIIDSSPDSSRDSPPASPTTTNHHQNHVLPEPIEFASSLIPESPSLDSPVFEGGRSPKRRRISINSSSESESGLLGQDTRVKKEKQEQDDDIDLIPSSSFPYDDLDHPPLKEEDDDGDNDDVDDIYDRNDDDDDPDSLAAASNSRKQQHDYIHVLDSGDDEEYSKNEERRRTKHESDQKPTFFNPPPFKPTDHQLPNHTHHPPQDHLPDIFSPSSKRRGGQGGKYVSGGLASELRDWLVDVKTETEKRSTAATPPPIAKLTIDAVGLRSGRPLRLISGRPTAGGAAADASSSSSSFRAILAGEGESIGDSSGVGLSSSESGVMERRTDKNKRRKKSIIYPESVVAIAPPAWDVDLPGQGRWAVAYRWEVVSGPHTDVSVTAAPPRVVCEEVDEEVDPGGGEY